MSGIAMNGDAIRILFLSDVHLGHHKVSSKDLILQMWDIIGRAGDVDAIVFPGDLFDRSIGLGSMAAYDAILFIRMIGEHCCSHGIDLILMDGTKSHDRGQMGILQAVVNRKDQSISHISDIEITVLRGIEVLWIPDNMGPTPEDVRLKVMEVMHGASSATVGLVVMHGAFVWQMPYSPNKAHKEQDYITITKTYVVSGHHHIPDAYPTEDPVILIPGSIGRLRHGEDHDKGALLVSINTKTFERSYERIYNLKPMVWLTIDATDLSITEVTCIIRSRTVFGEEMHVKIRGRAESAGILGISALRLEFPFANITKDLEVSKVAVGTISKKRHTPICLNKGTLPAALMARIATHVSLDRAQRIDRIIKDNL